MIGLIYLDQIYGQGSIPPKIYHLLKEFHSSYIKAIESSGRPREEGEVLFKQLVDLVNRQIESPYPFEIFHQSVKSPFNYYEFALNLIRPLIDFNRSEIKGLNYVDQMVQQLSRQENVILLANHQTEPDSQIIQLLLAPNYPQLASEMIFVAGHRVTKDPMAVPFSLGCNLLCIYSKKHMDNPPEEKHQKVMHNQRTIQKMVDLLNQGGHCIYVAPSGGRDRPNAAGYVDITPFDPQSLELFWLISKRATYPTHFYPLSLLTYPLFPPPRSVEKELGEKREAYYNPAYLAFGEEIDMNYDSVDASLSKKERQQQRAMEIEKIVRSQYQQFIISI